jgi:hypothetical protein
VDAERSRFIRSRGNYAAALRVSAHDYRLSLQLRGKRLLHRNEEGIQINMEDTARHVTAYKLAHRADKANPWSDYYPTFLGDVTKQVKLISRRDSTIFNLSIKRQGYVLDKA